MPAWCTHALITPGPFYVAARSKAMTGFSAFWLSEGGSDDAARHKLRTSLAASRSCLGEQRRAIFTVLSQPQPHM